METNRYFLENSDDGHSPKCEVTEAEMFVFLALTLQMGHKVQADWRNTGRKWNSFTLHSMDKRWHVLGTITYYTFYISQTIIGMELTEQMTDCGKYETCLKL